MKKILIKSICLFFMIIFTLTSFCGCKLNIGAKQTMLENNSSSVSQETSSSESEINKLPVNSKRGDVYIEGKGDVFPQIERILEAYDKNDITLLTDEKDIYIYECATKEIKKIINDDMSDAEKAKAIHDYIIINARYDEDALNEFKPENPDSASPYGFFKNKKCICLGYTLTFQLLTRMSGLDCIVIHSSAYDGEEHGWNMVNIDGKWYHVDVTWDDPIPDNNSILRDSFFCVSDEVMKKTSHEWDTSKYPNATDNLLY